MDFDDALIRTADLAAVGQDGTLRGMLRAQALQRVRSGAYVDPTSWAAMTPENRIRSRARAVDARATSPQVFVGPTAAAEWGLPLYRASDTHVHVLQKTTRGHKSRGDVVRHGWFVDEADVVERGGLLVTSLPRTLMDVSRMLPVEAAVACFDAALRSVGWRGFGVYDTTAATGLQESVLTLIEAAGAVAGVRQARFVAGFADGRAQMPGESVSRLWMHRLRVDPPTLQHEVVLPDGRRAYPDFAWPRRRRFGEFDGDGKYVDPSMTGGRDIRATLREQRARETAVTEATGWLGVRWGWERLPSLPVFAAFLRSHGVLD